MICPLCLASESELFDQDKSRSYLKCLSCDLVFVPRTSLITQEAEKERYKAHENEENENYTNYLKKTVNSITPHLKSTAIGLDFGCGKTKILSNIFKEKNFQVNSYDLFFYPDDEPLNHQYDFILLSEVIEHLRDPRDIMQVLKMKLQSDGQFFIKTKLRPDSALEFSKWFYKRDSTHVQFFNEKSFKSLKEILRMKKVEMIGDDLFKIDQ